MGEAEDFGERSRLGTRLSGAMEDRSRIEFARRGDVFSFCNFGTLPRL
jgi:hypothetical protein